MKWDVNKNIMIEAQNYLFDNFKSKYLCLNVHLFTSYLYDGFFP